MSDLEAALAIWQRSSEAHVELWASHLLFASAALGFAFTSTYGRLARGWQLALAFLFLNLAIVNAWSIWDNLALYNAAIGELQAATSGEPSGLLMASLHRIDAGHLLVVHLVLDAVVIFAMIRGSLRRVRAGNAMEGAPLDR